MVIYSRFLPKDVVSAGLLIFAVATANGVDNGYSNSDPFC